MTADQNQRAHPLLWVPSLYFAMGTPMIAVSVVAAIMYKNLGLTNTEVAAYTGLMNLPWVLKPLWAPFLELYRNKRFFVLAMELVMVVTFSLAALALQASAFVPLTIALFWISGFASATQDIAGDGVYITSTSEREQGMYMGIQGMFWNLGRVLVSGALVSLTAILYAWAANGAKAPAHGPDPAWRTAWMCVMGLVAVILLLAFAWHWLKLPPGARAPEAPSTMAEALSTTLDAWVSFFQKPRIWMMITVVFFYRFGEGFIEKMGPLFLLDKRAIGGLGLDNMALGNINGTFGTAAYITGTLLGGVMASKWSLKRTFLLLAFGLNVPHITYFYLSQTLPTDISWITVVVLIEKFGYGFGTVGMMLYIMQEMSPGRYRTAHYAFGTGIMALTMTLTGTISGRVQELLGYQAFFAFVLLASVPPIVLAWIAPFEHHRNDGGNTGDPSPGLAH
jgi:MFS transporter, PAT family, beta-lactamase induction signal transducer AmpG